jgi:RHS repeat-associated protein
MMVRRDWLLARVAAWGCWLAGMVGLMLLSADAGAQSCEIVDDGEAGLVVCTDPTAPNPPFDPAQPGSSSPAPGADPGDPYWPVDPAVEFGARMGQSCLIDEIPAEWIPSVSADVPPSDYPHWGEICADRSTAPVVDQEFLKRYNAARTPGGRAATALLMPGMQGVYDRLGHALGYDKLGADPVDPATGEFIYSQRDLGFPSAGIAFVHQRVYRSRMEYDGPIGHGWDHSYNQRLRFNDSTPCPDDLFISMGNGHTIAFDKLKTEVVSGDVAQHAYDRPPGTDLDLTVTIRRVLLTVTVTAVLTNSAGTRWEFDKDGLLIRLEGSTGHGITFEWEPSAEFDFRLKSATDSGGRLISYSYGADGRLEAVAEPTSGLFASYEYDDEGNLTDARNERGEMERYTYDSKWPEVDLDYLPEPLLLDGCQRECKVSGAECGGGACDAAVDEGRAACADACTAGCGDECSEICPIACAGDAIHAECSNGITGCNYLCSTRCEAEKDGICEQAFVTHPIDPISGTVLQSPEEKCQQCDLQCAAACAIAGEPQSCPFVDSDLTIPFCRCMACCRDGYSDHCALGSCMYTAPVGLGDDNAACFYSCKGGYLGYDLGSIPVDPTTGGFCDIPSPGCPTAVIGQCTATCTGECVDDCEASCIPACQAPCQSACADACPASCDAIDYAAICADACFQGCVDKSDAAGPIVGAKYGYPQDLNHNLLTIARVGDDGSEEMFVRNAYGVEVGLPSFDAVIEQQNGNAIITFDYRDLLGEERSAPPPIPGSLADLYTLSRKDFETVEICPNPCLPQDSDRQDEPPPPNDPPNDPDPGPIQPPPIDPECIFPIPGTPKRGRGPDAPGPKPASATVIEDPYGVVWTLYFDERGRTLQETNFGTGATRSYNYGATSEPTGIEHPLRDRACLRLDQDGRPAEIIQIPSPEALGSTEPRRLRYQYTTKPVRLASVLDPRDLTRALYTMDSDPDGRLRSITTALGDVTTFDPTAFGMPVQTIGPDGTRSTFTYDSTSATTETSVLDADGSDPAFLSFDHDDAGHLTSEATALGLLRTWIWTGGRLESFVEDDDGRVAVATLGYDVFGRVESVTRGDAQTTVTYDLLGFTRTVRRRDLTGRARDESTCTLHGSDGRVLERVLPEGNRLRYEHNGEGRVTRIVGGSLSASTDTWNEACERAYSGTAAEGVLFEATYDYNGRPITTTDATGAVTRYDYDGLGRVAVVEDARGTITQFGYDLLDNVTWRATYRPGGGGEYGPPATGDPYLMEASEFEYDAGGQLFRAKRRHFNAAGVAVGDGEVTTLVMRDRVARTITVTDDSGRATVFTLDGRGRLTGVTHPDGSVQDVAYTDGGRVRLDTWPGPTPSGTRTLRSRFTSRGQLEIVETDDAGVPLVFSTVQYDDLGRPFRAIGVDGEQPIIIYDAFDRPIEAKTTDERGAILEVVGLTYDRNGLTQQRDSEAFNAPSSTIRSSYDALGRLRSVFEGTRLLEELTYAPGASPLVRTRVDARGTTFTHTYDSGSALIDLEARRAGFDRQRLTFDVDALGRVTVATDSGKSFSDPTDDVVTELRWDTLGNREFEANNLFAVDGFVAHTHDEHGRATESWIGGIEVDRTFDGLGRLETLAIDGAPPAVTLVYSGMGGPIEKHLGSGVTTFYTYDVLGRLSGLTDAALTDLARWEWSMPADGTPRLAVHESTAWGVHASLYETDAFGRVMSEEDGILSAWTPLAPAATLGDAHAYSASLEGYGDERRSYTLDGRHNWQSVEFDPGGTRISFKTDERDALTAVDGRATTIDAAGSLTSDGDGRAFYYDLFGRLTDVNTPSERRGYRYDAFGRVVMATDRISGTSERYGYDGLSRALRGTVAGVEQIVQGDHLDEHLVRVTATGDQQFLHQDRAGSVYLVTDAAGVPLERYRYSAYGERSVFDAGGSPLAWSMIDNPFGFQGHIQDDRTGLVQARTRWYLPEWGRFLTQDPLGFAAGPNRYVFASSAPLSYRDPLGLGQTGNWYDLLEAPDLHLGSIVHPGWTTDDMHRWLGEHWDELSDQDREMMADLIGVSGYLDEFLQSVAEIPLNSPYRFARETTGFIVEVDAAIKAGEEERWQDQYEHTRRAVDHGYSATLEGVALYGMGSRIVASGEALLVAGGVEGATGGDVPSRVVRVVELKYGDGPRLGAPGASDVFVTSADDIAGVTTSEELARRLTLLDDAGNLRQGPFVVLEFDTPDGIAVPVFRGNPGFVQGGRTAGGASEYVVPNLRLEDLTNLVRRILL